MSFKPIIHEFEINGEKFIFKKPTVSDQVKIISRKQEIMTEKRLIPQILSLDEDEYLFAIAQLETCMTKAPENWYVENKKIDMRTGETIGPKNIISITEATIDTDEFQGVREEVYSFLATFRGGKSSGPSLPDRTGEETGKQA